MHNYTTLDSVLNFISPVIRKEESDLQLKSYAYQGFRLLKLGNHTVNNIEVICVKNHKAKIPADLRLLNFLTYMESEPTVQEEADLLCNTDSTCSSCGTQISACQPGIYYSNNDAYCGCCDGCLTDPEDFLTRTNRVCQPSLTYQVWLDSNLYKNRFSPLKYAGTSRDISKYFICDSCPNLFVKDQDATFTVLPETRQFLTNFKDGYLCVNYQAYPKNDTGDFLIPDDAKLLRALGLYSQAIALENKALMHEEGMYRMSQEFLVKAERMLKSYKGSNILENINLKNLEKIMGMDTHAQKILRNGTNLFTE